ncbi:hypothetical protein [Aeoliella mucimassa]|uniref:Core-binding (CB) domain-containing protein n=1 Tax=Aeoliella mucimassa TaxID=2527972 RepID=A0A518AM82_9BACT|nr:hypothetical protein [Aeoliella mucimassa]QDU55818.1 hypothetical protein Pan181_20140 [Aeoliella mucimassa]
MKPAKPYPGFPLTANGNGQWSKKIHGKVYYFGTWSDWRSALDNFHNQRDYLYLGQTPPTTATTVANILDAFLDDREVARDSGDLTERSYDEYRTICDTIVATLGKARPVEAIHNNDLGRLRSVLGKGKNGQQLAPSSHKRHLTIARMIFKYANQELGCDIRYAVALRSPSARAIRQRRNEVGERLFTADEIRALVKAAKPQLRAALLNN